MVFGAGGDRDPGKRPLMGRAAADADIAIVTSDNPRSENPAQIARQIVSGWPRPIPPEVILDREAAIRHAIYSAGAGDGVLIAGKGHEDYQIIGREKRPFRDADVARTAIVSHPHREQNWPRPPHGIKTRTDGNVTEIYESESSA